MSIIINKIEFLERTKKYLNDNFKDVQTKDDHNYTILMNLSSWIIISADEWGRIEIVTGHPRDHRNIRESLFPSEKLSHNLNSWEIPSIVIVNDGKYGTDITIDQFVNQIRHCFAHDRFTVTSDQGIFITIEFEDTYNNNSFKCQIPILEFKNVTIKSADEFILKWQRKYLN